MLYEYLQVFFKLTRLHKFFLYVFSRTILRLDHHVACKFELIDNAILDRVVEIHRENYLTKEGWFLNGVKVNLNFNSGEKLHRRAYTIPLVFDYYQFVFNTDKKLLLEIRNWDKFNSNIAISNANAASMRVYAFLHLYKSEIIDGAYLENSLKKLYTNIIRGFEFDNLGNHIVDNAISMAILNIVLGLKSEDYAISIARNYCNKSMTSSGVFRELNANYALILNSHLEVLNSLLRVIRKPEIEYFKYYPIPINDQYLKINPVLINRFATNEKSKNIGGLTITYVDELVLTKGYCSHLHDCVGSLFIRDDVKSKWVMRNKGTISYDSGRKRNVSRSIYAYPKVINSKTSRSWFLGQFRPLRIVDRSASSLRLIDQSLVLESDGKSCFSFYSDFSLNELPLDFPGGVIKYCIRSSYYDGLLNKVPCYKYKIEFCDLLEIRFDSYI